MKVDMPLNKEAKSSNFEIQNSGKNFSCLIHIYFLEFIAKFNSNFKHLFNFLLTKKNLYSLCNLKIQNLYSLCNLKIQNLYSLCNLKIQNLYSLCNLKIQNLCSLCNLKIQNLYSLCNLKIQNLCSLCNLTIQNFHNIYSRHLDMFTQK